MYGYEILHTALMDNLIHNVRRGHVQHAYIFEGERGVGTLEAAKLFANTLVCENRDGAPCTQCSACIMAKAGTHPDIYYVSVPKDKSGITVDQIRAVTADAYTKPYESEKKVYIITDGDKMNEQAQNAFLKVLEEPPQYAVFVILAENHETLLQTIRSRCSVIRFNHVPKKAAAEYLKAHYPENAENIDFLVRYCDGVIGKAEEILSDEGFMPLRKASFEQMENLLSPRLSDAYKIAEFLEENKDEAGQVLELWQSFLRDIVLIQNDMREIAVNYDLLDGMIRLAGKIDEKKAADALESVLLAEKMKKRYVSLRTLALKLAFSIKK